MNDAKFISVVIPTLNRDEELRGTIRYFLEEEDYRPFELIIIDQSDHHSAETLKLLQRYSSRIIYKKADYKNLPKARNDGARMAKGEIIVYVDDDVEPKKGFLKNHAAPYAEANVCGVAGAVLEEAHETLRTRKDIGEKLYNRLLSRAEASFDVEFSYSASWARGNNMSFRKDMIVGLNGFDENFEGVASGEDAEFCHRLKKTGGTIFYNPQACVFHKSSAKGGVRSLDRKGYVRSIARNTSYFWWKIGSPRMERHKQLWVEFRTSVINKKNVSDGSFLSLIPPFFTGISESCKLIKNLDI